MKIPGFIKSVVIGVPVGVTIYDTVGYVARVDGVSMQPVLNPNNCTDYVFLNRWAVRSFEVKRGDVVSLTSPKDPDQKIIKRVVGLQGDLIATIGYKYDLVKIPEGHCWVEGDHTGHSLDSNHFGPVSTGLVTAKATCIVWPPSRWQYIRPVIPRTRTPLNISLSCKFDFSGSVVKKGIALGDVDNDGCIELVVGNDNGEVAIFKGSKRWQTITDLGFVSGVVVGDALSRGRNYLVILTSDGWCYIYSADDEVYPDKTETKEESVQQESTKINDTQETATGAASSQEIADESKEKYLKRIYVQRIPPNSKDLILSDIDADGYVELVVGLTDRVVRSYRWVEMGLGSSDDSASSDEDSDREPSAPVSRLIALNKWECAQQIGSISSHHSVDGKPCLLVSQPGGSFMRIRYIVGESPPPESYDNPDEPQIFNTPFNSLMGFCVDYHHMGKSRMRNENILTEIVGGLKTAVVQDQKDAEKNKTTAEFQNLEGSNQDKIDKSTTATKENGVPYALATLDGTIMLVQNEIILWAIALNRQLFALTKLDVTKDGADEIIVCSWDGHTYILDQKKNSVRFQLNESVQAFDAGYYTLKSGGKPVTCFVYVTFRNKILLYYDIPIKNMVCKKFEPDLEKLVPIIKAEENEDEQKVINNMDDKSRAQLVEYLLYGDQCDAIFD